MNYSCVCHHCAIFIIFIDPEHFLIRKFSNVLCLSHQVPYFPEYKSTLIMSRATRVYSCMIKYNSNSICEFTCFPLDVSAVEISLAQSRRCWVQVANSISREGKMLDDCYRFFCLLFTTPDHFALPSFL